MKKRSTTIKKSRMASNSLRRQLLKRVRRKMNSRRQLYQKKEVTEIPELTD